MYGMHHFFPNQFRPGDFEILVDFALGPNEDQQAFYETFISTHETQLDAMTVPRFAQHDYDRAFSQTEHIETFGADTAHFWHPIVQRHVQQELIGADFPGLSAAERRAHDFAALTHDMGELVTGDAVYREKDNAKAEHAARRGIVRSVDPVSADEILAITAPILEDPGTEGFAIFELSERIGYIRTGGVAAEVFLHPRDGSDNDLPDAQRRTAGTIVTDIAIKNLEMLSGKAGDSSTVRLYMDRVAGPMQQAVALFEQSDPQAYARAYERATRRR